MKRSKHGLFFFPPKKTLIWRRHRSIGQSCYSMTSKRIIDYFLESFGHEVFSTERSLNQPKATCVCICPSDKPIKWLYFRSFVVSVLFACFHFKVMRKSLYLVWFVVVTVFVVVVFYAKVGIDKVEGMQKVTLF